MIVDYLWSPDDQVFCIDCPSTTARPFTSGIFTLTIFDEASCQGLATTFVQVVVDRPVYIPTAFTPDGNRVNDFFNVFTNGAATGVRRMQIFDRWGEMVYDGTNLPVNNPNVGWDGTFNGQEMMPAVFVYLVEVEFIDGVTQTYSGDIHLLR